jgi:signal transduction histidine kinase
MATILTPVRTRPDLRVPTRVLRIGLWLRRVAAPEDAPTRFERRLSSIWTSAKDLASRRRFLADVALAGVVAVGGLVSISFGRSAGWAPWFFTPALAAPLILRRRCPIAVFSALSAIAFAQWLANVQLGADLALLVSLYTVADERPRRVAVGAALLLEIGAVLAAARWTLAESPLRSFVFLSGLVAVALLLGANVRARRAHVNSLLERAARLEIERDQQAQIAAAAERTRIAREMHDVIAHTLAVIVALVDGASAKLYRDPEQAGRALQNVADLGRQTLDDTRRLLGVLRTSPAPESRLPQPGIPEIAGLLEQVSATGLEVAMQVHGAPVPLPPGPALTAYRIVQEATTNVLKHATGATTVVIKLHYRARSLDLEVHNDGPVVQAQGVARAGPTGFGLAGMRERAAIYDGSVSAGPDPSGGWIVRARLSLAERALR